MTLLSALRATKVLGLAVALVAGGMMAAEAGDGRHHRHRDHPTRLKTLPRFEQHNHGGRLRTELRESRRDRGIRAHEGSFYGGAIAAYRDFGNGTWFQVDGDGVIEWRGPPEKRRRGGPKIITITPGKSGCSWESGVCVIRPGS